MKNKLLNRKIIFRGSPFIPKMVIINSKLNQKMKTTFLAFLCLFSLGSYSQVSIPDTVYFYATQYETGSITFAELNSTLSSFFDGLPDDQPMTRYEKEFQRSMAFWKDRIYINDLGEEEQGVYVRALLDYLDSPTCGQSDEAHWKFNFDPSPINNSTGLLGQCTEIDQHAAGILNAVYMNPTYPNRILVGSGSSGIWRTSDGGANWNNVTDNLRIPALGIRDIVDVSKPSDPVGKELIAITGRGQFHDSFGAGVLRSSNSGATWTRHSVPIEPLSGTEPFLIGVAKPFSTNNHIVACSKTVLYLSTDNGYNWTTLAPPSGLLDNSEIYDISASSGSQDVVYISTKRKNMDILTSAKIYKINIAEVGAVWVDITTNCMTSVNNYLSNTIDEAFDFEAGFGGLTPSSYINADDVLFEIDIVDIGGGDEYASIPAVIIPSPSGLDIANALSLTYETDDFFEGGIIDISFNASMPDGASIECYFANEVGGLGTFIGNFTPDGDFSFVDYSETFNVLSTDYTNKIILKSKFQAPYTVVTDIPILIDDIHIELSRSADLLSDGIAVSQSLGDELYALVSAYDPSVDRRRLFATNTTNKGTTWEVAASSSGFPTELVLGPIGNFQASFGADEAFYFGGVKFYYYDFLAGDFAEICTQHDDVRDIQIVRNVSGDNEIIVGDDGGASFSSDGGLTWSSLNGDNLPITQFYSIGINPFDHKTIVGGTQDNGTFLGVHPTWEIISGGDGGASGFSEVHSNKYFYTFNENTIIVEDDIELLTFEADILANGVGAYLGRPAEIDPITGGTLFQGYAKLVSGHNNGTIVRLDIDPSGGFDTRYIYDFDAIVDEIGAIEIAPDNTNYIYAASGDSHRGVDSDDKFFRSTNYGTSYIDITETYTASVLDEDAVSTGKSLNEVLAFKNANAIETDPEAYNRVWIGISGVYKNDENEVVGGKFRVLYSDDAGQTWQDYSNGLPPFPINDLIYQKGTNDRLFAATDVGIFYRDASMEEWVCFQRGMPATFATDLEIDYCSQSLYAGTFGRGIWKSIIDLPDSEPIVISTNTTWSGLVAPKHDVIIEDGAKLTITGLVNMAGTKRIKVKQGAQLEVDGGTITNSCDVFWGGIEVWGNKDEIQTPSSNQGLLTLKNGAVIENAEIAVTLWEKGNHNATGGIILASSSTFKNNKKDVEFRTYQNRNLAGTPVPNKSFFSNVTFTWDDDFMAEFPLGHVTLYQVDGIQFKGCTFADDRTAPTSRYLLNSGIGNSGIYSIDAQYYVAPICTDLGGCTGGLDDDADWTPTTFRNLDFGVYASNVNSEHTILVDRSIFENNLYGVEIVNVNTPVITRNQFVVTDVDNNFLSSSEYGIHAVRSKGLKIEENEFEQISGSNTVFGIVCSDLGESEEQVYNNTFTALDYAVLTQGKNRNFDPTGANSGSQGLQFLCNDNVDNTKDHTVLNNLWGGLPLSSYGVKRINGNEDIPSGTVFSDLLTEVDGEHYNNLSFNAIRYYYYTGDPTQEPEDYLGAFNPFAIDLENVCPSKLESNIFQQHGSGTKFDTEGTFFMAAEELDSLEAEYLALVNGGNTDSLMDKVDNLLVENRAEVRTLLSSFSPYLTRQVIENTVDNPVTKYPHAWSYELIVDNIEVAYEPGFMDFLASKTYPLPTWMIDDIQAKLDSNITTDMTVKQTALAALETEKAYAANLLMRSYKNDTLSADVDSVRYWIAQKNDILAQTRIIDSYVQEGDWVNALSALVVLNAAIQDYPEHLQTELSDYVSFKNKILEILDADGNLDALDSVNHAFITNVAENGTGLAKYQAQELLCFFFDECTPYLVLVAAGSSSMASTIQPSNLKDKERFFEVYPNPANDYVTLVLPQTDEQLLVTVVDLTGRIVFNEIVNRSLFNWDTKYLGNGTYLITVSNQTRTEYFGTQKLLIQH